MLSMKTSKNFVIAASFLTLSVAIVSWSYSPSSKKEIKTPFASFFYDKDLHGLSQADIAAFMADEEDYAPSANSFPAAEDVLVQRIPGDNGHILVIAYYSKENYSEPSVTIDFAGSPLTLADDGKGFDKKAGD